MQKPDFITVATIVLCVFAGVIIGQGFSIDVRVSDLLTLAATLITFFFAKNGLQHNERQYLNSIRPILSKYETFDNETFQYSLQITNFGSGAALKNRSTS